jgi:hypothetical protein
MGISYDSYDRKYTLIPNRCNEAVNDILAQLANVAKDLNGVNLLQSATRTLGASEQDIISTLQPSPEETPCVRVFGGQRLYDIQAVDFVRLDEFYQIPLYFIYYNQGHSDFEDFREAHIDYCIRWLEKPDQDTPTFGLEKDGWQNWGFKIQKWNCTIDHDTPLKYLKMINLQAPYFCSRVDLTVQVNQVGAAND